VTFLRLRDAVRALVVDVDERVLLVRFRFPNRSVWALPGGGVQPGEDDETALRRELLEEVGLSVAEVGPVVWHRTHVFPFLDGSYDGQTERVHLVRTDPFVPAPALGWEALRAEYVDELRWWTLEELETSTERFAPRRLATLVPGIVRDGPPAAPFDSGV
jgi:8-oxo-dGTP pyrophosphatase MutT (NUDIX family)